MEHLRNRRSIQKPIIGLLLILPKVGEQFIKHLEHWQQGTFMELALFSQKMIPLPALTLTTVLRKTARLRSGQKKSSTRFTPMPSIPQATVFTCLLKARFQTKEESLPM